MLYFFKSTNQKALYRHMPPRKGIKELYLELGFRLWKNIIQLITEYTPPTINKNIERARVIYIVLGREDFHFLARWLSRHTHLSLYVVYASSLERHYSIRATPCKIKFSILTYGALDAGVDSVSREHFSNTIRPTWDRIFRHEKRQNRSIMQSYTCNTFIISIFRLANFSNPIYDPRSGSYSQQYEPFFNSTQLARMQQQHVVATLTMPLVAPRSAIPNATTKHRTIPSPTTTEVSW